MDSLKDNDGFGDPAVRQQLDGLFTKIQDEASRRSVNSPFTEEDRAGSAGTRRQHQPVA